MNKIGMMAAAVMVGVSAWGADGYDLVTQGTDYVQINENLDAFTITSDFGSVGNSGHVGYYVYTGELTKDVMDAKIAESIKAGDNFNKKDRAMTVKALSAGDKIGFYLLRNNGNLVTDWHFVETHKGGTGIQFDKNGGKGYDETLEFGEIVVVRQGQGGQTSGMPLPGFLPALLVGGLGLGGFSLRRFRRQKKA